MKKTLVVMMALATLLMTTNAYAGRCDHSWQTASDGSACGDRAADQRPGGR